MPTDLNNIIYYVIAFVFVIALIAIGARLLKGTMNKSNSKAASFLRGRDKRLGVVEAASVDGRRKLILLRRDDVEHLIMTGGPVDVVIETGIESSKVDTSRAAQRLTKPIGGDGEGSDADRGPTLVARAHRSFSKTAAGDG